MKKTFCMALLATLLMAGCTSTDEAVTADNNPVIENILSRRSIRSYKPDKIEREKLDRIIECGIWAPNGQHRESWEVRVVTNPDMLAEIDSLYNIYSNGSNSRAAFGAPAVAFIAYDTTYDLSQVDCGLLGGNMMLAANSMGIGSCCLGGLARFMTSPQAATLLARLDFPDTHRLLYAIAFGYPNETPAPNGRRTDNVRIIE